MYSLSALKTQLTARGFYADTPKQHENFANNVPEQLRRSLFVDMKWAEFSGKVFSDIAEQSKNLITGVSIKVKFTLNKPEFHLRTSRPIAPAGEATLPDTDHHNKEACRNSAKYHKEKQISRASVIPRGVQTHRIPSTHMGELPEMVLCALVENINLQGSFETNPFKFVHKNMTRISVEVDGVSYPTKSYDVQFGGGRSLEAPDGLLDVLGRKQLSGGGEEKRPVTHTRDLKCPCEIYVAAQKRRKCVRINKMLKLPCHNHELAKELWNLNPDFEGRWQDLIDKSPDDSRNYLNNSWYTCRHKWSMAFRNNARTYGINTNSTIGSFFHALKGAIKLHRRTAPHNFELIQIVYAFCCEKVSLSIYTWYLNQTTKLSINVEAQYQPVFDELGHTINDWAVRAIHIQFKLFLKNKYEVEQWADGSATLTSTNDRIFYIHPGKEE
ncbi:hypothetical protein RvY_03107 [Ramazzottius varieornatus]|uniref:Uncharacterized protein n=1 Tax=Ramazzottius varieornatus TaxID=947166 RepID=A0A1D1ULW8_RAMVA|nr:hypothetical protein RvY_03107 [Ramazzottius varieornatus]